MPIQGIAATLAKYSRKERDTCARAERAKRLKVRQALGRYAEPSPEVLKRVIISVYNVSPSNNRLSATPSRNNSFDWDTSRVDTCKAAAVDILWRRCKLKLFQQATIRTRKAKFAAIHIDDDAPACQSASSTPTHWMMQLIQVMLQLM